MYAVSAERDTSIRTSFAAPMLTMDAPVSWFIPGLVTGVPGLLIILLVMGNVVLGVSWLPGVGRLLGPEPDQPDDDDHVWWAAGRPLA